ncbi:FAD/NAD(P)-binding domain-containing protein [Piedraia hortae CBS 480.64]|uniref:FAD/NAD(P)-binding domain-containing protein n=1 Tax=Piedraia hortae CBS 480.64 TaxID=1314780 RepID=A0A6A7C600_9PEZI|nr:FAD/NAD(P)-binding domain-containing protein [Piedraia hortae CBS 480.64]
MTGTKNIVILGGSFAGQSIAHYLARHTLPKLQESKVANYKIIIVDPSTQFWWHIAAPRAIVSVDEMKHEDCFKPILDGFKQYSDLAISHLHGTAIGLNTDDRIIAIKTAAGEQQSLHYDYLVIATGVRSPTPLTTLQGDHTLSTKALDEINGKIKSAKTIAISGGGPIGVEIAGEIAYRYPDKEAITLITGSAKLLPILRQALSDKAQQMLERLGVKVKYNTLVTSSEATADGQTTIKMNNGETLTADVYIPAYGVSPNTEFLPDYLKTGELGWVKTNGETLRVDAAGPRVYAAGDVAAVDLGGVLKLYGSIPVLGANMSHDLLEDAGVSTVPERTYLRQDSETQFVPIGPKTGVAAYNGWKIPGFMVGLAKGKDYMIGRIPEITEGRKFSKP